MSSLFHGKVFKDSYTCLGVWSLGFVGFRVKDSYTCFGVLGL